MQKNHFATGSNTSTLPENTLSDALVALLTTMCRPGVELVTRADGVDIAVSTAKSGALRERRVARTVVASAARKGLIEAVTKGSETEWRVTDRGRSAYRRVLMAKPARYGDRTQLPSGRNPGSASRPARTASATPAHQRRSIIEQLALRKDARGKPLLDGMQLAAGKRLAEDFAFAHLHPRVTQRWSAEPANAHRRAGMSGTGLEISAAVSAAGERVRRALSDLGGDLADLALDVCCFDKTLQSVAATRNWSTASTRLALVLALGRLAQHYGMITPQQTGGRIRQWADAGFKPTAESWTAKASK